MLSLYLHTEQLSRQPCVCIINTPPHNPNLNLLNEPEDLKFLFKNVKNGVLHTSIYKHTTFLDCSQVELHANRIKYSIAFHDTVYFHNTCNYIVNSIFMIVSKSVQSLITGPGRFQYIFLFISVHLFPSLFGWASLAPLALWPSSWPSLFEGLF